MSSEHFPDTPKQFELAHRATSKPENLPPLNLLKGDQDAIQSAKDTIAHQEIVMKMSQNNRELLKELAFLKS